MTTQTRMTYAVQHPQMSHALIIDTEVERTDSALAAWGAMYVLRHFDEMLPHDEFEVRVVPATTPDTYSIFETVR